MGICEGSDELGGSLEAMDLPRTIRLEDDIDDIEVDEEDLEETGFIADEEDICMDVSDVERDI